MKRPSLTPTSLVIRSFRSPFIRRIVAWFASGVLDSVQATVVDINSLWNSGTYGGISPYHNDNIHYSDLVYSGDAVHFTIAGYDSVANAIFRIAHLAPVSEIVH